MRHNLRYILFIICEPFRGLWGLTMGIAILIFPGLINKLYGDDDNDTK